MQEISFMVLGFGFFIFVINMVVEADKRDYLRKVNEQREFGYRFENDPPPKRSKK